MILSLSACGTGRDKTPEAPLLPMPVSSVPHDPDNDRLMTAIAAYVQMQNGPANSRYEFTRIDLDNDGRREGLVMMKTPSGFWCGIYGCRMAVFQAHDEGFSLLSDMAPVRGPVTVSDNRTNGWRDLVVLVDGRTGWDRKEVALHFDGRTYPAQPAFQPAVIASNSLMLSGNGVRIFP
jgi:hypothetical protein